MKEKEDNRKQLNIYFAPGKDIELLENFEKIVKYTRSDKSKTIKFLIGVYVKVMEPRVLEINSALEEELLKDPMINLFTKNKSS